MTRRASSPGALPVRSPIVEIPFRPYVAPKWEPPRPGSMRHLELPSVAGGVRHFPIRPWAK